MYFDCVLKEYSTGCRGGTVNHNNVTFINNVIYPSCIHYDTEDAYHDRSRGKVSKTDQNHPSWLFLGRNTHDFEKIRQGDGNSTIVIL